MYDELKARVLARVLLDKVSQLRLPKVNPFEGGGVVYACVCNTLSSSE